MTTPGWRACRVWTRWQPWIARRLRRDRPADAAAHPYRRAALAISVLAGGVGLVWWSLFGLAPRSNLPVVGFLSEGPQTYHAQFWKGLEALGLRDGQTIRVVSKIGSGDQKAASGFVDDLLAARASVIVATNTASVKAVLAKTTTVPVVMVTSATPVESGFIDSFAVPGRNVTGLTMPSPNAIVDSLDALREVVPNAKRLALLWNSTNPVSPPYVARLQAECGKADILLKSIDVHTGSDLGRLARDLSDDHVDGLIVVIDQLLNRNRSLIIRTANELGVPAVYPIEDFTRDGGLMSLGVDFDYLHFRAASFVNKILKGVPPSTIPVERSPRLRFAINLRTARQIGVRFPTAFVLKADSAVD